MELEDDIKPTDDLYQKILNLVKYLAECIIRFDLDIIILAWMKFRLEKSSSSVVRLKEIFQVILHNDMTLEIINGHLILFKDAPLHTHIPLGVLNSATQECLKVLLAKPLFFFESVDITAFQTSLSTYSKFKFLGSFRSTDLWKKFITHYMELLESPQINNRYLGGRAIEILICFITSEITYAAEDFEKNATGTGAEWRESHKRYLANIHLLYEQLTNKRG